MPIGLKHITFRKVIPIPHMQSGGGLLPDTEEACALWQFLVCASQALEVIPAQISYEGDEDAKVDLMQIAYSARVMYGLKDLEGMFNDALVFQAKREAERCNLPWNPKLDDFFRTGGKSHRFLDRDPDKVGQMQ